MKIGFMQGRLCDQIDGKIQAFPWSDWELEFERAQRLNITLMEWTLDYERLYENPLMTALGRKRIIQLSKESGVKVVSLTCDFFMQAPFFKVSGKKQIDLLHDLYLVLDAAAEIGLCYVVLPLVDNSSLASKEEEIIFVDKLLSLHDVLAIKDLKIIFESDFSPERLKDFIEQFPDDTFGINYDIGNSAALGYSSIDEISSYGHRIDNVHVKDRILGGTTVPLGQGNADFPTVFKALRSSGYRGSFILQTARVPKQHDEAVKRFQTMTLNWWNNSGS